MEVGPSFAGAEPNLASRLAECRHLVLPREPVALNPRAHGRSEACRTGRFPRLDARGHQSLWVSSHGFGRTVLRSEWRDETDLVMPLPGPPRPQKPVFCRPFIVPTASCLCSAKRDRLEPTVPRGFAAIPRGGSPLVGGWPCGRVPKEERLRGSRSEAVAKAAETPRQVTEAPRARVQPLGRARGGGRLHGCDGL